MPWGSSPSLGSALGAGCSLDASAFSRAGSLASISDWWAWSLRRSLSLNKWWIENARPVAIPAETKIGSGATARLKRAERGEVCADEWGGG